MLRGMGIGEIMHVYDRNIPEGHKRSSSLFSTSSEANVSSSPKQSVSPRDPMGDSPPRGRWLISILSRSGYM